MRQFFVGRGDDCQIRLFDNSQRISRNHATLKLFDNGKICIVDHSSNGTFVNGIKISQNVDYPVKRGDSISFAHVTDLNWNEIPKNRNRLLNFTLYSLGVLLLITLCVLIFPIGEGKPNVTEKKNRSEIVTDSLPTRKKEKIVDKKDSITHNNKKEKENIQTKKEKRKDNIHEKKKPSDADSPEKNTKKQEKAPNVIY
jgi:pSer/pThr/pTyr-binding forkhead associated (FHA) protein